MNEFMKRLERSRKDYRKQLDRASDDYCEQIKYCVADILEYIDTYYPFQQDYFSQLKETVVYQLDLILYRRRDLQHQAINEISRGGNIDWFAEPFFGVRKLKLSKLLEQYDDLRYERSGPTADCYAYFRINPPLKDAEHSPRMSERDNASDEDDDSPDKSQNSDFKRQRSS